MKTEIPRISAAFVTEHESWPWKRQLPADQDTFDGVQFFVPPTEADIVFVYDALPNSAVVIPRAVPAVFVASEPENVKRYNSAFLGQFDAVVTSDRATPHPNRIFTQAGLPWHAGSMMEGGKLLAQPMTFEEFEEHDPRKTKLVSVVSSDKAFTAEHRARLEFVAKLKVEFGDKIDVFGRGIANFADKRDVLDAYRYHISIENCSIEDYWTEKISDSYLALTFPIYHGCKNISEYFPKESFIKIDIYNADEAIEIIRTVINSNIAEQSREHLLEARRRVMHEHNVFGMLARVARDLLAKESGSRQKRARALHPESHFTPFATRINLWLRHQIGRQPGLPRLLRFIKYIVRSIGLNLDHYYKFFTDDFYRSRQRWIRRSLSDDVRFRYHLPSDANILDAGGGAGDFSAHYVALRDANVTVIEPIGNLARQLKKRFAGEERVRIYEAGLSDKDETVDFDLDADASGAFGSSDKQKVKIILWDAERFLGESDADEWHLAKLDIEGLEYRLLNRLIDTGRIKSIQHLQVKFHLHVPDARRQYRDLAKRLERTHRLQWRYPFVWESWVRREDVSSTYERQ